MRHPLPLPYPSLLYAYAVRSARLKSASVNLPLARMELSMFFRKFLASAGTDSRKCGCTSRMFCGMFLSVSIGVAPICTVATEAPQAIMM